jgi:hypothetical protein
MKILILTKTTGERRGLKGDYLILDQILSRLGHKVVLNGLDKIEWDVKIMMEHITPSMLKHKSRVSIYKPNIELLDAWDIELLPRVQFVMCKNHMTYNYFSKIHKGARLTKFMSIIPPLKMKKDPNLMMHVGGAWLRNTSDVIKCWHSNKGFIDTSPYIKLLIITPKTPPKLEYLDESDKLWESLDPKPRQMFMGHVMECEQVGNMWRVRWLDYDVFSKLRAATGTFIQPSLAEGFGHSINEGRMMANVITTDSAPMNELIKVPHLLVDVGKRVSIFKFTHRKFGYDSKVDAVWPSQDSMARVIRRQIKERADYSGELKKDAARDEKFFKGAMVRLMDEVAALL